MTHPFALLGSTRSGLFEKQFWRHIEQVVAVQRLADVKAPMGSQRVTHGVLGHEVPAILADPSQPLATKGLLQLGLVSEKPVEIVRGAEFPEHIARGTQTFEAILQRGV